MANYDNPNGFRPSVAFQRRARVTVGAVALHEGDVVALVAGLAVLYSPSTATHRAGPYGVCCSDGAVGATIEVYEITDDSEFVAQYDGTYDPTSHNLQRYDISGATGAMQIGTTQVYGTVQVLGHAPETGSEDTGANARVRCRFAVHAGAAAVSALASARSSSVPAADADQVTNTTTATAHATTKTLVVAEAKVGDVYEFGATCKATATNSTNTLASALKLGSVTLGNSPATDVANGDVIRYEGRFEIKQLGESGKIQGSLVMSLLFGSSYSTGPLIIGPDQSIDLSADLSLSLVETWSAASTGNKVDLVELWLRRRPAGF